MLITGSSVAQIGTDYADKNYSLGQGWFSGLMADEAAEFTTVWEAPIRVAKGFITIHGGDII